MPNIRLCFLWHMHQPFYKDMVTGEYRLPWVRMHALKDYYGMVKLLDEFDGVRQTFNLVPSLLTQLEDYVQGTARDPFYDLVAKPAGDLTHEERLLALRYLFQANETHLVGRYPRYSQLLEQRNAARGDLLRLSARWTEQDFRDLQVLSQLAWFDEYFSASDPEVADLIRRGKAFTLADQQLMLAKQAEILRSVVPAYLDAQKRQKIEISVTPFYHPILPLICDTQMGRVSAPGLRLPSTRFCHPDDARLQMSRALEYAQSHLGLQPRGMWPSEGSVSNEVLQIAGSLGLQWMATDEGVLGRSINSLFERESDGVLKPRGADELYRPYLYETGDTEISLLFRDHSLSDLIGFVYSGMPAKAASEHFLSQIKASAQPVLASGRDALVSVILDGENAWEHYPQSGRESLRNLYSALERDPLFRVQSISAALSEVPREEFGRLNSIVPGSWINSNFNIWIGAPEDNASWDLLGQARSFFDKHAAAASPDARALALEELLIAEGSDWNWWYGPEHHTANDADFDDLYRSHLRNVYTALGATPPEELNVPLIKMPVEEGFTPQSQFISPKMAGKSVSYFDWLGAATLIANGQGAMHRKSSRLTAMHAGFDEDFLFARLDFGGEAPTAGECVLDIEGDGPDAITKTRTEFHVLIANSRVKRWWLTRKSQDDSQQPISPDDFDESLARLTQVLEVRMKRSALQAMPGQELRIRFTLREEGSSESLPREGWMRLAVLSEEALTQSANLHW